MIWGFQALMFDFSTVVEHLRCNLRDRFQRALCAIAPQTPQPSPATYSWVFTNSLKRGNFFGTDDSQFV
jgi:hypothetical protein